MKLPGSVNGRSRFFLLAAVPLLLAGVVYGGSRAYSFAQSPSSCSTCHTMKPAYEAWASGEHQTVNCHSCHEGSFTGTFKQLVTYVLKRPDHVDGRADVPTERCTACHSPGATAEVESPEMPSSPLHQLHAGEQGAACLACHGPSLHRVQPAAERSYCQICHTDRQQHNAPLACVTCHSFGTQAMASR